MGGLWNAIGDFADVAKKIAKQATGNDLISERGIRGIMNANEQGIRDTLVAKKVVKSFNNANLKATADFTTDAGLEIKKGASLIAKNSDDVRNYLSRRIASLDTVDDEARKVINTKVGSLKTDKEVADFIGYKGKEGLGYGNVLSGYFGDETLGSTRTSLTMGGVIGTGVGLRYLQGGDLTTKPTGERDIAGIPFV